MDQGSEGSRGHISMALILAAEVLASRCNNHSIFSRNLPAGIAHWERLAGRNLSHHAIDSKTFAGETPNAA
jgi:hypothetical protein